MTLRAADLGVTLPTRPLNRTYDPVYAKPVDIAPNLRRVLARNANAFTFHGTGTYIVGRLNQHWADFDKPPIPDQADIDEYNKVIGSYVESVVARYDALMPKVSNLGSSKPTDKFAEIITFRVKYGKDSDFESAIARINDAAQKTKWPVSYIWYSLAFGGNTGDYVLVLPHQSWADFEGKPDTKPFRDMLKDGLGQTESDSIISRIDAAVASQTAEIIQFRPDLSYLPTK